MHTSSAFDWLAFATRVKHDLGKGIAWWSANLSDAQWQAEVPSAVREAWQRDLLATRQPLDAPPQHAWSLWQELCAQSPDIWPPLAQAERERIEAGLAALAIVPHLVADPVDWRALSAHASTVRQAQQAIRDACVALVRWARSSGD